MPTEFTELSVDFCSLGQSKSYYIDLKELLGNKFHSFLYAMKDVAIFPKIYEQFEHSNIFIDSVIRSNSTERLARTIRFEIDGIKQDEYFKFNYRYKPPYSENAINFNFDFKYDTDFEHRIYALIGKNGTGKTKFLSSLAKSLSEKESKSFVPRKPVFGKVFTVSYSFFDRFEIPKSDSLFNYVYCGLKKRDGAWKNDEELLSDFYKTAETIKLKKLENEWFEILGNFLEPVILEKIFSREAFTNEQKFSETKFNDVKMFLSSGQNILLYLISEILAEIRFDSLILFDEPETHLHPNAISNLVNTLYNLVNRFQSFCIIATHSSQIIQEIPARNIFILEREDDVAYVRGMERESLGENLTIINQEIFGNKEVQRYYQTLIKKFIAEGKSSEEIIEKLESDELPVTSNILLFIKTLIDKR